MHPRSLATLCGVALGVCTHAPLAAQQLTLPLRPGFEADLAWRERASPFGVAGFAAADDGTLFVAIDNVLWRLDPTTGLRHQVRALPIQDTFGIVVRPRDAADVFYTEWSTNTLWRHDPRTAGETRWSVPANTFDLTIEPSTGAVLASANPDWPQPGATNGVWLLDPTGGTAHREIVALSGPSGPLHVDVGGDLLYATQSDVYPTPPGSQRLLRFTRAQLLAALGGGLALTAADASVAATGLNGVYDLTRDDHDDLLLSDARDGTVRRARRRVDGGFDVDPAPLLATRGTNSSLGLQFLDGDDATLDAWQPARGGTLWLQLSDWSRVTELHAVRASRPTLTSSPSGSAGAGTIRFDMTGLPATQPGWLLLSLLPPVPEQPVLSIDDIPVWLGLDLLAPPIGASFVSDATGSATIALNYPGGVRQPITLQAFGLTPGPRSRPASTRSLTLQLLP